MKNSKASILIVEDSFIVAYHLRTTLETEGYHVAGTIESGEESLRFLQKNRPDLILMDIMLSGNIDGVETARIVRAEYNIPVVYITALSDRNTIGRAKVTEPFGYVTKPFEDREIFTVIEMALYKHAIELKLKQSEEKYFSTVRSISDAVILIDSDFKVTYANPAAERLLEFPLVEIQGRSLFSVMEIENSETGETGVNPVQCEINSSLPNSFPGNLVLVTSNSNRRFVGDGNISPIIDNKGQCVGSVIIFKDLTQKIENDRLQKTFQRERLTALLEGQESERSRIARDLHDGLGQLLTAVKMNIPLAMGDHPASATLCKLIDDAIQESVRISENLLPVSLKDFDLHNCIERMCTQMRVATNCKISFELLGEPVRLEQGQKINFYRICQEAVNNALKHSQATQISVQLMFDEQIITLTVEDNGRGFSRDPRGSMRHGLGNMSDRAQVMGGKLTIESDTNRGTLVIVEAPCSLKTLSL